MGRQRNKYQYKGNEESPETVLNEIEASTLSDIEFQTMVMKSLNELSEYYKELQGSYGEITVKYISKKKDKEVLKESQEEIKNIISEMENLFEEINALAGVVQWIEH